MQLAVLVLVLVLAFVVTGLLIAKVHSDSVDAGRRSLDYTPPPIVTATPSSTPTAPPGPLVTIVSDETTSGAYGARSSSLWPALVESDLDVDLSAYADEGAGYVTDANDGDGDFQVTVDRLDPVSKVVLFFGGGNDAGAPTLSVVRAATLAYSTAKSRAPVAKIVVVGPVWGDGDPPASILAIRDALKASARVSGARFVDPIQDGWFRGRTGMVSADRITLTPAGTRVVANKMRALLQEVLG